MSYNVWETTLLTSLCPLTHFLYHLLFLSIATHNDIGDVVSHALWLTRLEYLRDYEHLLIQNYYMHSSSLFHFQSTFHIK